MRIGCHAVLFADKIATQTDDILESLHRTGGEGVEIGARFFGLEKSSELKQKLENNGVVLSGLHVSIKLTDVLDDSGKVEESLKKAASFLKVMPDRNIIMTGMAIDNPAENEGKMDARLSDPGSVRQIASRLDKMEVALKNAGVQLHYHNHSWEFKNDGLIFFMLAENAPHISFALDTGWAAVSGYDPVELVSRYPGRFHYVHLRDYNMALAEGTSSFKDLQNGFTEIGEGNMDFPRLLAKLKEVMASSDWAVIEYEKGAANCTRYTRAVGYLKKVLENL